MSPLSVCVCFIARACERVKWLCNVCSIESIIAGQFLWYIDGLKDFNTADPAHSRLISPGDKTRVLKGYLTRTLFRTQNELKVI